MKLAVSSAVLALVPALVAAHADHADALHARHHPLDARQATPSHAASSTTSTPATGAATSAPTGTGTGTPAATATPSFTLLATNPTAVPLSDIVSNQPSSATLPLASTAVPGTTPSNIPGAPPLPNAQILLPSNYPALDVPPPIDSDEVKQWIQEVQNTGVVIPNFAPTNAGGCPNNTAAVADTSRCWWTCGGCTRSTDITECPTPLNWGLTYDDGPSFYTSNLLSYLDQVNLKSTFFVVGSRVISFPATLQTQYLAGHQIAVHTWSHPSLTMLSNEEIIAELGWSKKVIKDVLGVTPNMMRPPFGDIDDRVRAISLAMGLTPVMWTRISPLATYDTDDFNIHGGTTTVQQVLQNWENILGNATTSKTGFIVLEHDLFEQTVEVATGYILPDALAHNPPFTIQPVVSCLKQDMTNAYIETNNNSTNPPAFSAAISGGVVSVTGSAATTTPTSGGSSGSGSGKSSGVSVHVGSGLAALTTFAGALVGGVLSLGL
ncbi:glycoside hydrolase/deacetylase [Pholiota conissans]|uniref:chitin deacetylase n=1 Tax=Pholiota conissans TaxID=109636 RepID=A0A9P5Z978_9AGAR|nr:glycoside hydrolase/deacetylase [Pholiota conissans]